MRNFTIGKITIGEKKPLAIICGPCVIENETHTLMCVEKLHEIFSELEIPWIFKASYDKANRSSIHSFRGPGIVEGLRIFEKIKAQYAIPILTDIHSPQEAADAKEIIDVLQIPAFLCRQTDLVVAAAETGLAINVKKGQFLAPWDMSNVIDKILATGNENILLTDRGTSFGYNNLASDMRAIPIMQKLGFPVCFDATHSAQLPGGHGSSSAGQREFIPHLARASIAAGANALYIEAHPNPKEAKSDKDTVIPFSELPSLLKSLSAIYDAMQPKALLQ